VFGVSSEIAYAMDIVTEMGNVSDVLFSAVISQLI
jgi:hypothetical protein